MAYQQMVVAALMISCLPLNEAIDHLVGGERGWVLELDYKAWAESERFYVGDKLVFNYQKGDHNVIKVNETEFRDCTSTPAAEVLDTGKDVIALSTPGKKWYICGIPGHCNVANQKLEINVLPQAQSQEPPSFSDAPPSSIPSENSRSGAGSYFVMVALTVIIIIVN